MYLEETRDGTTQITIKEGDTIKTIVDNLLTADGNLVVTNIDERYNDIVFIECKHI